MHSPRAATLGARCVVRAKPDWPKKAEGDANFVTSLEAAAPAKRGKKRGRHRGNPAEEERGLSAAPKSRRVLGDDREDPSDGAAGAGHAEAREGQRHPWRQRSNKLARRERCSSSAPPANQDDGPPTRSSRGAPGGFREDRVGPVAEDGGCAAGGGVSRGISSGGSNGSGSFGSRAHGAAGVGATAGTGTSSSSSRWSKYLR